jgi:hypothetical protein
MYEYNLPPHGVQIFGPAPDLPPAGVRWSNRYWMPSALKPAEVGGGTALRFWNASDATQEGFIECDGGLEGAMLARMDETPIKPLPPRIVTAPREIVTILFQRGGAP